MLWYTLVYSDPNYYDYLAFYPLSLINFVDYTALDVRWQYPLKALNVFEVIYWVALSYGIFFMSGKRLATSRNIVLSTYVLFFLVWLGFYVVVY